jgi:hypothetical protein
LALFFNGFYTTINRMLLGRKYDGEGQSGTLKHQTLYPHLQRLRLNFGFCRPAGCPGRAELAERQWGGEDGRQSLCRA